MGAGARGIPGKIQPQKRGKWDFRPEPSDAAQGRGAGGWTRDLGQDPAGLGAPGKGRGRQGAPAAGSSPHPPGPATPGATPGLGPDQPGHVSTPLVSDLPPAGSASVGVGCQLHAPLAPFL